MLDGLVEHFRRVVLHRRRRGRRARPGRATSSRSPGSTSADRSEPIDPRACSRTHGPSQLRGDGRRRQGGRRAVERLDVVTPMAAEPGLP